MIDLLAYLPSQCKRTGSGWISFNAPCCQHNGETADQRQRGGIKHTDQGWSYHCFNCGFTASFIIGRHLAFKARRFLQWLNVPNEEIERINLESLRHRSMHGLLDDRQRTANAAQDISFEDRDLPAGFILVDKHTPVHWQYLQDRCVPLDSPMGMVGESPRDKWKSRPGIIIPFTYNGCIVGHTTRFLDDKMPKYIHDMQPGYVFGTDLQRSNWQHVLVVEGVFDALSISGVAVLHADVNDKQARLIRSLNRKVTVVPDQDSAGLRLVDRAIELGWAVSMPDWSEDIKDVNDAVKKHGRFATLMSIMQHRETSKIKIEMRRKKLKRIRT